ncbi:uncharacterized protein BX664DRAFT_268595 [Halteromyces radiatus]|uniref:uncharacterized protein n=1 Tax=Halteromyces radiatus TaxID=101107 RepID=UPI00221E5EDC|nr:uncharacterized protein BX664DRAFT_268595 [Halteromyces radiatus]KAI8081618.1 hypothetical protein BX664DRAFT_268595 [Halteromyces radiatus]
MPLDTESSSWIPTLQCPEFQVKYQVKAVLEYQQQNDYTKKRKKTETLTSFAQPVIIVQLPTQGNLFSSDNMLASIDSRKHTNRWCQYRVIIDKRFAAMTSTLNLSIRLAPMIRGLKLGLVSMHIVQRFTIKNNTSSQSFSRTIPLSCHYQSTPFPSSMHAGGTLYEGEFQYKIPDTTSSSSSGGCLVPSIETSPIANIKVEHLLLVHLALTFPCLSHDGIVRRAKRVVTFQCDFDLLHPCMAESMSDDFMCLPAYDHPRSIIK